MKSNSRFFFSLNKYEQKVSLYIALLAITIQAITLMLLQRRKGIFDFLLFPQWCFIQSGQNLGYSACSCKRMMYFVKHNVHKLDFFVKLTCNKIALTA